MHSPVGRLVSRSVGRTVGREVTLPCSDRSALVETDIHEIVISLAPTNIKGKLSNGWINIKEKKEDLEKKNKRNKSRRHSNARPRFGCGGSVIDFRE